MKVGDKVQISIEVGYDENWYADNAEDLIGEMGIVEKIGRDYIMVCLDNYGSGFYFNQKSLINLTREEKLKRILSR